MKHKFIFTLSTLSIMLILSGCASKFIPSVVNAPMLKNKGEVQASINVGTSGLSPKIAYGITDNIGVMLNGSYENTDSSKTNNFSHKHNYVELAGGYFKTLGSHGLFDVYAGYGYGNIKTTYSGWSIAAWNSKADFNNQLFFIQPSIGYSNKIIDINFASKFSLTRISNSLVNKTVYFIAPVVTFKVGYKYMKIITQIGASIKTGDNNNIFEYNPFVANIGLQIDLFRNYE